MQPRRCNHDLGSAEPAGARDGTRRQRAASQQIKSTVLTRTSALAMFSFREAVAAGRPALPRQGLHIRSAAAEFYTKLFN